MSSIVSKVIDGIKAVAPTVANLVLPGSGPLVHKLMRAVTGDSPETPIEEVAAKIEADPHLLLELRRLAVDREVRLAAIESGRQVKTIEAVNATMRVEASQGHPWSGAWRPFWGFCSAVSFGLCVIGMIVLAAYAIYARRSDLLASVPTLAMSITALFGVPGAILGVASWHRGRMQRVAAGEQPGPGLIPGIIKAMKGA